MKNFEFKIDTQVNKELQEIHLTTSRMLDTIRKEVMSVREEAIKKALIALGWTPPWNYNMEEAPRDGTRFLFKEEGGRVQVGRYDSEWGEEQSVWVCLTLYGKDWYPSIKPIAWKPIVD